MSILEELIKKVLASHAGSFEDSTIFTSEIAGNPEAAEILAKIADSESGELSTPAGEMLCLFGSEALGPILQRLTHVDPDSRGFWITILWPVLVNADDAGQSEAVLEVVPALVPMLGDISIGGSVEVEGHPIELECEPFRLCDEAFLMIKHILEPEYDDDEFRCLGYGERDAQISLLRSSLRPLV